MSKKLGVLAFSTLMVLLVQFLLGMATNLYVTVPAHDAWGKAHPAAVFYPHAFVGLALLVACVLVKTQATEAKVRYAPSCAVAGLLGVAVALGAGMLFVSGGGVSNLASFVMSLGFAGAVLAYASILWLLIRHGSVQVQRRQ